MKDGKGRTTKTDPKKKKKKTLEAKWERKLRDAHICSALVCAFCFKGILI